MDMLNAVKSMLADVSSVSPSSEQKRRANEALTKGQRSSEEGLTFETSANTLFTAFSISTSTLR